MSKCKDCGSCAINEHLHGRSPGEDLDLCDVCYWRKRADEQQSEAVGLIKYFVKRVEEGTIRSKLTYKFYKDFLSKIKGEQ